MIIREFQFSLPKEKRKDSLILDYAMFCSLFLPGSKIVLPLLPAFDVENPDLSNSFRSSYWCSFYLRSYLNFLATLTRVNDVFL